jgi:Ca-activated chloride channel homolog
MTALPLMNDEELSALSVDPEAGFGALETARGHLPLKALDVRARISGLVAHVDVRQTFSNALHEPLEATYIFPLPPAGAVTKFRIAIGGRIVDGVLEERGKAREDYEQAIEAGFRAAIAEEERPNVFTLRVGNLLPGEEAEVRLTLEVPLPFCDGEATFRFPLVVAPRYIPGTPLPGESVGDGVAVDTDAVPDASRITPPVLLPGFLSPVALNLVVQLDTAGLGARRLRSSLPAFLDEDVEPAGRWQRIGLRLGTRLDRDFVLRFEVAEERVKTALLLCPDAEGDEGTYLLTLTPPVSETRGARPRDVVFVLDRSGSMGGWKMVAARRALARMIDTLSERDRFAVVAFDHRVERFPEGPGHELVPATDRNRFRAIEQLARLEARGGTEMAQPLQLAADTLAGGYEDRDPVLVLVTDGQVGNEAQILRALAPRLKRTRIFTLGVDRAVNEGFLKRLAAVGGGACELVESEDRLDEVMARVHRRIDTPVLTELHLEARGLELLRDTQVPARLPALFAGAPLVVSGRFRGRPEGALHLTATDAAGGKWSETVAGTPTELEAVAPLWARGQLREMEDLHDLGRGGPKLTERLVQTSLRFGVLCRFTAFVAIDRAGGRVNPGGDTHRVTQPVEAPSGWSAAASFAPPPPPPPAEAPPAEALLGGARAMTAEKALDVTFHHAAPDAPSPLRRDDALFKRARRLAEAGAASPPSLRPPRPAAPSAFDELAAPEEDDVVLSGYRLRAQRLLDGLVRDHARLDDAGRRRALGRLAVELRALLEDAASVGLGRDAVAELDALLRALQPAVATPDALDEAAVAELLERALRALAAFAGPEGGTPEGGGVDETQSAGSGRRGREFWK